MLIILEGPDGAGKSTVARGLEELLLRDDPSCLVEVRHSGIPRSHPLDEYLRTVTDYRPGRGRHLILDRFHWGESVYPLVRDRPTKLDPESFWTIENYLRRLGALVVTVTQYVDEYRRVYRRRGDDIAELQFVEAAYRTVCGRSCLPTVNFNWQSPVNGDLFRVVDEARELEVLYESLGRFVTYLGPATPGCLLLGDVRHGFPAAATDWNLRDPAFVPHRGTSGHYLIESLRGAKFLDVGLANACDVDEPVELWRALGEPEVVALGRNAERQLRRRGFPLRGVVPHPQYVRRFHNRDQFEYGMNIKFAATQGGDFSRWHDSSRLATGTRSTHGSSTSFVSAGPDGRRATAPSST